MRAVTKIVQQGTIHSGGYDFSFHQILRPNEYRLSARQRRIVRRIRRTLGLRSTIAKQQQVVQALDGTASAQTLSKRLGVSPRTIYRWRKRYGVLAHSKDEVILYHQLHVCPCGQAAVWLTRQDPAEKRLRGACPRCTRPISLSRETWDFTRIRRGDAVMAWFLAEIENSKVFPLALHNIELLAEATAERPV